MKALAYARYYFKKPYTRNFAGIPGLDIEWATDFPTPGMADLRTDFYRVFAQPGELPESGFDEADMLRRCRLLRHLEPDRARRMLRAMAAVVARLIDRQRYDSIIGPSVDNYIADLFARAARQRSIGYVGLCDSYFPGYTQITTYGEEQPFRAVAEAEAVPLLERIRNDAFRQNYRTFSRYHLGVHWRRVLGYLGRRAAFGVARHLLRDPHNFQFLVMPHAGIQKRFRDFPRQSDFHPDWERRIGTGGAKAVVYLPLSFTPEMTTDYWIEDVSMIDYEDRMLDICTSLSTRYRVVVKDHFHMLGIRRREFYRRLNAVPGLVSVPPQVNSNVVLQRADKVVLGAGSVGIEATVRGKQVFSYCPTCSWFAHSGARAIDTRRRARWPDEIAAPPSGIDDPLEFIRRNLETNIPFMFSQDDAPLTDARQALAAFARAQVPAR